MNRKLQQYLRCYGAETFDAAAWFQVADQDYQQLMRHFPFDDLLMRAARDGRLELLDVGCGTGRFPSLLTAKYGAACGALEFAVDYVDPVRDNLSAYAAQVGAPFHPRGGWLSTLEDLTLAPQHRYDVVWAIHSLAGISWPMERVVRKIHSFVKPGGVGYICKFGEDSFYQRFYKAYQRHAGDEGPHALRGWRTSQEIGSALRACAIPFEERRYHFYNEVPARDEQLLEKWLRHCVLDDQLRLAQILNDPALRGLIDRDSTAHTRRLAQTTSLFRFSVNAGSDSRRWPRAALASCSWLRTTG